MRHIFVRDAIHGRQERLASGRFRCASCSERRTWLLGIMAPAAVVSAGQPPEIQFAQRLASNEKRIRDRALKKLRGYMTLRTQSLEGKVGEARGTKHRVRPALKTKIHMLVIAKYGKDRLQSVRSKRCFKMMFI